MVPDTKKPSPGWGLWVEMKYGIQVGWGDVPVLRAQRQDTSPVYNRCGRGKVVMAGSCGWQ